MQERNEQAAWKKKKSGRGKRLSFGKGKQRFWRAGEKAAVFLFVCVFALCGTAGCKGKTQGQPGNPGQTDPGSDAQPGNPGGTQPGMNGVDVDLAKQAGADYPNGVLGSSGRLMLYGKGLYYDTYDKGLRYADLEKNIDMVLCNKPECRHDGNAFCVATNEKYARRVSCIYGGKLLVAAVEQTDTQYLCKLLSIALDGSAMDELVTFYTLEKTGKLYVGISSCLSETLFVHRGKAVVYVEVVGQENLDDTLSSGNFVIDLATKEVSPLGEVLFGKDVMPATNLQAWGDSIFYSVQEGKTGKAKNRHTLYEYNIKDKTARKCGLQSGFQGDYVVMEDGTVYYYRTKRTELWKYDRKTEQSELVLELKRIRPWAFEDGTTEEVREMFSGTDIATDGTYIYIPEHLYTIIRGEKKELHEWLHVYNKELEEVVSVNLAEVIEKTPYEEGERFEGFSRGEFDGGDIFLCYGVERDGVVHGAALIYKIKRSELLLGDPVAELVYEIGRE